VPARHLMFEHISFQPDIQMGFRRAIWFLGDLLPVLFPRRGYSERRQVTGRASDTTTLTLFLHLPLLCTYDRFQSYATPTPNICFSTLLFSIFQCFTRAAYTIYAWGNGILPSDQLVRRPHACNGMCEDLGRHVACFVRVPTVVFNPSGQAHINRLPLDAPRARHYAVY
jgi:hypothetical protein